MSYSSVFPPDAMQPARAPPARIRTGPSPTSSPRPQPHSAPDRKRSHPDHAQPHLRTTAPTPDQGPTHTPTASAVSPSSTTPATHTGATRPTCTPTSGYTHAVAFTLKVSLTQNSKIINNPQYSRNHRPSSLLPTNNRCESYEASHDRYSFFENR